MVTLKRRAYLGRAAAAEAAASPIPPRHGGGYLRGERAPVLRPPALERLAAALLPLTDLLGVDAEGLAPLHANSLPATSGRGARSTRRKRCLGAPGRAS